MKCKRCGSKVDGNFCQTCGAPVENPNRSKAKSKKSKKPNGCLVSFLIVFIFSVCFLASGITIEDTQSASAPPAQQQEQTVEKEEQKEEKSPEEKQPEPPKEESEEPPKEEPKEEKQQPTEEQPNEPAAAEEQSESKTPDFGDGNNIEVKEEYVLNTATLKFHHPHCRHVKKIEEENFATCDSREQAISSGYQPCKVCCP